METNAYLGDFPSYYFFLLENPRCPRRDAVSGVYVCVSVRMRGVCRGGIHAERPDGRGAAGGRGEQGGRCAPRAAPAQLPREPSSVRGWGIGGGVAGAPAGGRWRQSSGSDQMELSNLARWPGTCWSSCSAALQLAVNSGIESPGPE